MQDRKAKKLMGVDLSEVSLVDIGADPNAKITLFKRGETMDDTMKEKMKEYMDKGYSEEEAKAMFVRETKKGGPNMDPQELAEKLEALEGQVEDLTKRAEGAEAEMADLKKAADEAGFDVTEEGTLTKRADVEFVEIDGERFEKSAIPATILKALADKETELAKAKSEQEEVALAKRGATELPHLAGTDLAKGKLLTAVGDNEDVLKALKAADAALKKQMEEIGLNPMNDDSSATFRLNKMATDHATTHNVPFETAYAEVTKSGEGKSLMDEARAEAN